MGRAEALSNGRLYWGLLTNGGTWRLYYARGRSRSEDYVEFNLRDLLDPLPLAPQPVPDGAAPDHWMRVFLLLFRRQAFEPGGPGGATFLSAAMKEGRTYQARVTEELSGAVFERVFPALVRSFAANDPKSDARSAAWRAEAREGAIRLLYRLLFLFYAEDRNLLPVQHPGYAGYCLRKLREEAAEVIDGGVPPAERATQRWARLADLTQAIAGGDRALGLPAYNGDLFRDKADDALARVRVPDRDLIPVIDAMSREMRPGVGPRWINYRDLSVQHLGSIYEKLLEHEVVEDAALGVSLRPSPYARKATGSFYTREELVSLILRQAVEPLIAERRSAFQDLTEGLGTGNGKAADADLLKAHDPAEAILGLRVCDPAMGSGHFLVSLIDHLTDAILTSMAETNVPLHGAQHQSPVSERIVRIRDHIVANAKTHGWHVPGSGLDDKHIVRRMVLKRCVFGVDLNPMAVELAKLSLWLHSFTVGAPLSFLNHHLRCGDSLFGEFVGKAVSRLQEEYGLAISPAVASAQAAAAGMADIESRADADIAEVHASRDAFERVEAATAPLRTFLGLYHASRWLPPANGAEKIGRQTFFGGGYGDPVVIANGGDMNAPGPDAADIRRETRTRPAITAAQAFRAAFDFVQDARAAIAEGRFLHWEAAFPGVWEGWESAAPTGGFHAVIGNPPWDRIKMQEVEWWAARREGIASISRAADRKAGIAALRRAGDPLAADYDRAAHRAKRAAEVAAFLPYQKRDGTLAGPYALYPLFAKGDVNVYSLFVERAGQLVRPDGIVGLLVPSGVAADKGASHFFRSISNTGRLGALLDFENRRPNLDLDPFFPAVDSRFKFSALVHGGTERRYEEARCAFFQQDAEAAERDAFGITPEQFARANPNTGTAPVFRSPRDADIVLGIYGRAPVLVDRRAQPPCAQYPVAYARQLDMTNDSGLFLGAEELEADGAYPVAGGGFEKGNTHFLPLMVGRSIHLFDHRFASVTEDDSEEAEVEEAEDAPRRPARRPTRSRKVHNPYSSSQTTAREHEDPAFHSRPRYWVEASELAERWPEGLDWAVAFRDIARPTDARTVIACVVPRAAFGNKLPLLLPALPDRPRGREETPRAVAEWQAAREALLADYKQTRRPAGGQPRGRRVRLRRPQ